MFTNSAIRAAVRVQKRRKIHQIAALASSAGNSRTFAQPSAAAKATVLDIPQSRLMEAQTVSSSLLYLCQLGPLLMTHLDSLGCETTSPAAPIPCRSTESYLSRCSGDFSFHITVVIRLNCHLKGHYSYGPPRSRCYAAFHDRYLRKST
jgi:hypothetical protein